MLKRLILIFLFSFLVTPLYAASFDCSKATTKTEKAICADRELSALDELIAKVFFSLDKTGRYFDVVVEDQKDWVKNRRKLDNRSFKLQLDFLMIADKLNNCSRDKNSDFKTCLPDVEQSLATCMANESYTTVVMNRCLKAYLGMLRLVERFETELFKKIENWDTETVDLFEEAYPKWLDFIKADCSWRYSQYRSGTMRNQVWYRCYNSHYEKRVLTLNSSNRFQGKDEEFLKN